MLLVFDRSRQGGHPPCKNSYNARSSFLTDAEYAMTLETLIAAGVFGWLVIGMVMMGLGIW